MSRMRSASSSRTNATGASNRSGRTNNTKGANKSGGKMFEYPCAPCSREKANIEATNYCQDCRENLCASCVKQHLKFPLMKDHKILGKADRKSGTEGDTSPQPSPLQCPHHPGKLLDMYCADHDEVWCGACIALNHKTCTEIMLVEEVANGIGKTGEFKEVKENIKKVKKNLLTLKKKCEREVTTAEKQKTALLKRIQECRKRVEKVLDEMEMSTVAELDKAHNGEAVRLKDDIKQYDRLIDKLEVSTGLITAGKLGKTESDAGIFVGVKQGKRKVQEGERVLAISNQTITREPIRFDPDPRVIDWLQSLRMFGTFSFQQKVYIGELHEKHNVKQADDVKDCDIFGCKFIPDGRLLLTDWDNRKVKLLNTDFQIVDNVVFEDSPNDVCVINPQEVVVSLPMDRTIQFIHLEPKMTLKHMFKTDESCRGLAFHDGQIYVACGGFKEEGEAKLIVYSMTGDIIREIETNNSGQRIFICPIAIEVSADGSLLHVVDGRRGIVTLTQQNDVISAIADRDCIWPCGICLDRNGNAMVCSGQSHNVIQVSGINKIGTVLSAKNGLKRPHSICFDPDNMRLVVTMDKSNSIYVYNVREPCVQRADQVEKEATSALVQPKEPEKTVQVKKVETDTAKYNATNGIVPEPTKAKSDQLGMYRQKTSVELKTRTVKRDKTNISEAVGSKSGNAGVSKQQTAEDTKHERWKTGMASDQNQGGRVKQTTPTDNAIISPGKRERSSLTRGGSRERNDQTSQAKGRPLSKTTSRERTVNESRGRAVVSSRVSNNTSKSTTKPDSKSTEDKNNSKDVNTTKSNGDRKSAMENKQNSVSRGSVKRTDHKTSADDSERLGSAKPSSMASRIEQMQSSINNVVNSNST